MAEISPKVSVILCTYNRPYYLTETIASVVGQSMSNWELLVINDGGRDVGSIVEEFNDTRIRYFPRKTNRGKAACCNFGLDKARAEYIAYIDDDDTWYSNHLELLSDTLDHNPKAGVVYSDLYAVIHIEDKQNGRRYPLHKWISISRDFNRAFMFDSNHALHVSLMHRKEAAVRIGGYNELVSVLIDWNLTRKLAFIYNFIHIPQPTGEYSTGLNSKTPDAASKDLPQINHIGTAHRKNPQRYIENTRRIKADFPDEPWPYVHKIEVIYPVIQWDESTGEKAVEIIDDLNYPVRILFINNGSGKAPDECRNLLGTASQLGNVSIISHGRRLSLPDAFEFGARQSSADYVFLLTEKLNLKVVTNRLVGCLNYLNSSDKYALKWDSDGKSGFDLFAERNPFCANGFSKSFNRAEVIRLDSPYLLDGFQFDLASLEAGQKFNQGDYTGAYTALKSALSVKTGGSTPQALSSFLFKIRSKLGKYAEAEKETRSLIERGYEPDNLVILGQILQAQKKFEEAGRAYSQGLRAIGFNEENLKSPVFPHSHHSEMHTSTALVGLGECLFEIGRNTEAARVFETALKTWSLSHRPYLGLGRIHLAQGRLDEAEKYFSKMAKLDGKENPEVHRAMGLLCEGRDQPELALSCYLDAFKYDPTNEKTLDSIYEAGAGLGKWEEIRGAFKKFLQVNPGHDQARKKLSDIEFRLKKNSTLDRQKKTNPQPQTNITGTVGHPGQNTSGPKTSRKTGRNAPCPCGSGKKFKKCCLNKADARSESAHLKNQDSRPSIASTPGEIMGTKIQRGSISGRLRIRIISPADFEADVDMRPLWGDYWVKEELTREFSRLGCVVEERNPAVILYLFGTPIESLPKHTYNIVWVYSHPDLVTPENLRQFDKIFSLAPEYTEKLVRMGYSNVETMIGATSKIPLKIRSQYDIVFVGNSRGINGRRIVTDIGMTGHNFKVWGNNWENILPAKYFGGRYWEYRKLDELYASSIISINDHHPDMAREGFVAVKIFDILASGGFAISDRNEGIESIFGETVPQYESKEHLRSLLDFYIENPSARSALMERGREIALSHTYQDRARQILKSAPLSNKKPNRQFLTRSPEPFPNAVSYPADRQVR